MRGGKGKIQGRPFSEVALWIYLHRFYEPYVFFLPKRLYNAHKCKVLYGRGYIYFVSLLMKNVLWDEKTAVEVC